MHVDRSYYKVSGKHTHHYNTYVHKIFLNTNGNFFLAKNSKKLALKFVCLHVAAADSFSFSFVCALSA